MNINQIRERVKDRLLLHKKMAWRGGMLHDNANEAEGFNQALNEIDQAIIDLFDRALESAQSSHSEELSQIKFEIAEIKKNQLKVCSYCDGSGLSVTRGGDFRCGGCNGLGLK